MNVKRSQFRAMAKVRVNWDSRFMEASNSMTQSSYAIFYEIEKTGYGRLTGRDSRLFEHLRGLRATNICANIKP